MSSDNIAIRMRNPGKKYTRGGPQEKYLTLRDAIVNSVKAPFKRFHPAPPSEEFGALKGCVVWCGAGRGCGNYREERCGEERPLFCKNILKTKAEPMTV